MKIFNNPNATMKTKYGQYQIAVLGNIVAVSAQGMADSSAIERYGKDMMEVIEAFGGQNWAFLGFLHGPAVLTKDAEYELQKSIQWRVSKGMALGALVIGQTTIEAMVKSQFERVYRNAGVELDVHKDEQGALDWLAERGFHS